MKYVLVFILTCIWMTGNSQVELPWELERFEADHYAKDELDLSLIPDVKEAFHSYYAEYKKERASDPDNYYPEGGIYRHELKNYIENIGTARELPSFMEFLETGNLSSLNALTNTVFVYPSTLPYRFLGAMVSEDKSLATQVLDQMDQNSMISPVLKAWGENAVRNQNVFMTNGLQDLIALSWALDRQNRFSDAVIFNRYVNTLNQQYSSEEIFLSSHPSAWISPVYHSEFLEDKEDELVVSGIGFQLYNHTGNLLYEITETASEFKGLGLPCKSPADIGMISSYAYFSDQLKALKKEGLADSFGDAISIQQGLESYIKKSAR